MVVGPSCFHSNQYEGVHVPAASGTVAVESVKNVRKRPNQSEPQLLTRFYEELENMLLLL